VFYPRFIPSDGMGGAGRAFGYSDLSTGTRRVIRMLVSLLFDKSSVMLIEQPEDSIHSGLLRKLIDLFRSYSDQTQVIFSTHSSAVVDMLKPDEVLLVTAEAGATKVRPLSQPEIELARKFMNDEGSLSDYLGSLSEQGA
jgi:predicted ATPase